MAQAIFHTQLLCQQTLMNKRFSRTHLSCNYLQSNLVQGIEPAQYSPVHIWHNNMVQAVEYYSMYIQLTWHFRFLHYVHRTVPVVFQHSS